MPITISSLTKDDIGSFYPIFATAMKTLFACYSPKITDFFVEKVYTPLNLIYWLNNNLKTVIVAKEKDRIAGFAMIDQPYGGVSFCRWLAVLKQYQQKGIGRQLIQTWEKQAKSQSCHKIELASHSLAKKFYEKEWSKMNEWTPTYLPKGFNRDEFLAILPPEKDVDNLPGKGRVLEPVVLTSAQIDEAIRTGEVIDGITITTWFRVKQFLNL